MAGFAAPRVMRNGGGGSFRGGFVGPSRTPVVRPTGAFIGPVRYSPPPRIAPPPSRPILFDRGGVPVPTSYLPPGLRADFISHYDPSRVMDIDQMRVVKDLRQSGTERGETQTGDSGMLGPGGGVAPPGTAAGARGAPGAPGELPLVPIALAVAAFILFGG